MNKRDTPPTELEAFEAVAADQANAHYLLKLYITGTTPSSTSLALVAGLVMTDCRTLLSLASTGLGVLAGAKIPIHEL